MTHLQYQKRRTALSVSVDLAILLLIMLAFVWSMQPELNVSGRTRLLFVLIVVGIYSFAQYWLNKRRKSILLTKNDFIEPITPKIDLSNRLEWTTLLVVMLRYLLVFGFLMVYTHQSGRGISIALWGMFAALFCVTILPVFSCARNQYIIEENTLHIREYSFFKQDTMLSIPIETIKSVHITKIYSTQPTVILSVDDISRQLQCFSHADELAVEILKRQQKQKELA